MKTTLQKCNEHLAAGLGMGYLPKAPGTFGSLWGPVFFFLLANLSLTTWNLLSVPVVILSVVIAEFAERSWQTKDDQRIVIDEVAGMWVTYGFVTFSYPNMLIGFLLFRLFDVLKLFPARLAQDKLPGGIGVVADDVVAGIQAGLVLWGLNFFGVMDFF